MTQQTQGSRRVRRSLGLAFLCGCAVGLAACSTNYGGQFLPDKKSNVTLRQFVSVASGGTAATGGAAGTGTGSPTAANGGTSGPLGGNPSSFTVSFDPFPNGATVLLGTTVGTSIANVSADNRTRIINIEVTFRGHDVNNNKIVISSNLPATGQPDPATVGNGGGGAAASTAAGIQISTLRPSTVALTGANGAAGQVLEFFPQVAGTFSITNGISFTLDEITLRYFEPDGTLAAISAFDNKLSFFMEANPISTGFTSR